MPQVSARSLLLSFLVLNIATGTVAGAMQIIVPLYAMKLHASAAEIGVIRGISGVGMLLLVIPAGFLVDHFGSRKLFLLGGLASTLLTLALSFAGTPFALAALLGMTGLFAALKMTALNASFFSRIREMGLARSGWFKGSMSIGLTFVGPLLGGYLDLRLEPRQIFQLLAWLTLIPCALVFFFHDKKPKRGCDDGLLASLSAQWHDFRQLLRERSLYLPLMAEAVATGCFATFSAFIVVVAIRTLHVTPAAASVLMSIEGGVFILTVFTAGRLITLLTSSQLYLSSVALTVVSLSGLALSGTFAAVATWSGVLGFGLGLFNLVTSSRIGLFEGDKGKIVSVFAAAVGAGISIGPMVGGAVGRLFGDAAVFLTFVPAFLLLAVVCVAQDRRRDAPAASPAVEILDTSA